MKQFLRSYNCWIVFAMTIWSIDLNWLLQNFPYMNVIELVFAFFYNIENLQI